MTSELAQDIYDSISDQVDDVSLEEIDEEVQKFRGFGVSQDSEIRRSVIKSIAKANDVDPDEFGGNSGSGGFVDANIEDITEDGNGVNLTVKVVELWDANSDAIAQTGLIGDPTGRIKFTTWEGNDPMELEEGKYYELSGFLTDEWNGRLSVKGTENAEFEEVDADFEVGDNTMEIQGALVDIQEQSGFIQRCPHEDCTRVLQKSRCSEHGEVDEEENDLRLKAVIDDGENAYDVHVGRELTEELTGMTLEEAMEIAMDAMDRSVPASQMKQDLVGRYFSVTGFELNDSLIAQEMEEDTSHEATVNELLVRARSL